MGLLWGSHGVPVLYGTLVALEALWGRSVVPMEGPEVSAGGIWGSLGSLDVLWDISGALLGFLSSMGSWRPFGDILLSPWKDRKSLLEGFGVLWGTLGLCGVLGTSVGFSWGS